MNIKEKSVAIITLISIIIIIFVLSTRISGFFVQFQDEIDAESFLLGNLEMNVSSINNVEEFMEQYISRSESCNISRLSEIPSPSQSLVTNYDDVHLRCRVLSHTAWTIYPVGRYYLINFYFDNGILREIYVGTYFIGP